MSGRGLGHTGGTLDKLESIPGFRVDLSLAEMKRALARTRCVMIGQTAEIAPADKRLYALRDVTGTVQSIPLISASIMSKKIAEGIDALVLDVKTSSGAFMKTEGASRRLAESLVAIGNASGVKTEAVITDMDQPLGRAVGNALEVIECIEVLRGRGPQDLLDLSLELSAWMFYLGERTKTVAEGRKLAAELIARGKALENFRQMVSLQGGDARALDDISRLPTAQNKLDIASSSAGAVSKIDSEKIGVASLVLGGGRSTKEDVINPAVGIMIHKKVGEPVAAGEPLCTLYYDSNAQLQESRALIESAYQVSVLLQQQKRPLIHRVIQGSKTGSGPFE